MAEKKPPAFSTFGEMLKHLRQRAQMTQDELGLAVGYSRAHIARLESNQRTPDAGAVKARFFEPLDLKADSSEAVLLVKLAQSAKAIPSPLVEAHEAPALLIPNNLPYELTSFIGREQALQELERLLPTTRLLTLTGTGGTGKTRLALKLAERVMGEYADGVWLVELAPLSDPAMVPAVALSALNLRELPDKSPSASLIAHLQDNHVLLILDNCEHVIEACAQLAEALLRGCRHLRVLCTGREALGIAGELAWRVPSLGLPDAQTDFAALQHSEAITLFVERATFAAPHFKLTRENASAVLGICKRLDGIPLAIELAAARVKALTPADIAARLDDRFRLLAGGSRTALPRQQTLQAAVDWSYRLLSEVERLLLSRLAVFTGGWALAAAEHVCAGEGIEREDVLSLLSRLVDKSLVVVDDAGVETRYFLLETIRQYAIEKLNAGDEAKAVRDRHLEYFLVLRDQVFDELSGMNAKDQIGMVKRLGPDIDNIRQAIRWALDTKRANLAYKLVEGFEHLFIAHAGENEMLAWTLQIGEDESNAEPLRAEALFLANILYSRTGRGQQARQLAERVYMMIEQLDMSLLRYAVLVHLAYFALLDNRLDEAHRLNAEGLELAQRMQVLPPGELDLNQADFESSYAIQVGDYQCAVEGIKKIYEYTSKIGQKMASTATARRLGYALLLSGDPASARPLFRESIIDNHALGDRLAVSACLFAFGTLAEKTGDLPRAACLFASAIKVRTSAGLPNMPWDVDLYEPSLTAVQSQLNQPELAAMWAQGEAMTLEQAMAYALDD